MQQECNWSADMVIGNVVDEVRWRCKLSTVDVGRRVCGDKKGCHEKGEVNDRAATRISKMEMKENAAFIILAYAAAARAPGRELSLR